MVGKGGAWGLGGSGGRYDETPVTFLGFELYSNGANSGIDGFRGQAGTDAVTTIRQSPSCQQWGGTLNNNEAVCDG